MATSKTPATKDKNEVAEFDYSQYSHHVDQPTQEELLIPFLVILQPMSPQVTEGEIEGAKAGQYFNTVTNELFDSAKGVPFQPVHFDRMFIEWVPREDGGGIVARYEPDDEFIQELRAKNENSVVGLKNGKNDIIETYYIYGNILNEDGSDVESFAVLPVKSTGIKSVRSWRTAMRMVKNSNRLPTYAFRALLTTERKTNDKGTWWQFKANAFSGGSWKESQIKGQEYPNLYEAGSGLAELIMSGQAKADFSHEEEAAQAEEADAPF